MRDSQYGPGAWDVRMPEGKKELKKSSSEEKANERFQPLRFPVPLSPVLPTLRPTLVHERNRYFGSWRALILDIETPILLEPVQILDRSCTSGRELSYL